MHAILKMTPQRSNRALSSFWGRHKYNYSFISVSTRKWDFGQQETTWLDGNTWRKRPRNFSFFNEGPSACKLKPL